MSRWIVITTINPPTRALERVSRLCTSGEWNAVVIGDTRTPPDWRAEGIHFLDVAAQRDLYGELAEAIPLRHYSRKNLGYLFALEHGADVILDMDDDNIPYDSFGSGIEREIPPGARIVEGAEWVNVYRHFVPEDAPVIWPRGLPLDSIHVTGRARDLEKARVCPIQQYLADNDPDVDAIYRLLQPRPLTFDPQASPVVLGEGVWVPINAQNAVFFHEAFPLTYLPARVSFRMTDIWRSFVALAALAVHGFTAAFRTSTVTQERNVHDLMRDFEDEVPGYLNNRRIGEELRRAAAGLSPDEPMSATALALWKVMITSGFVPEDEWPILSRWFARLGETAASPR
jgi:hypothetical protein